MNTKLEVLRLIKQNSVNNKISYPMLDMRMGRKGVFGSTLKILIDSYVEEGLLAWISPLSLTLTKQGERFLTDYACDL